MSTLMCKPKNGDRMAHNYVSCVIDCNICSHQGKIFLKINTVMNYILSKPRFYIFSLKELKASHFLSKCLFR